MPVRGSWEDRHTTSVVPSRSHPRPYMGVPAVWAAHVITVSGIPLSPTLRDLRSVLYIWWAPGFTINIKCPYPFMAEGGLGKANTTLPRPPDTTSALNVQMIPKLVEVWAGLPAVFLAVACPPTPVCYWPPGFTIQYQCFYPLPWQPCPRQLGGQGYLSSPLPRVTQAFPAGGVPAVWADPSQSMSVAFRFP